MTVRDLLRRAAASLRHDSPSAALDAELLLAYALGRGWSRERLAAYPEAIVTAAKRRRFAALIQRRRRGEPVAYLLGRIEFYGLNLRVTPDVLIPRPESESLVEAVLAAAPAGQTVTVADVGTGSGGLAIALAHERPHWTVYATDVSAAALAVARANARRHRVRISFRRGDLLAPLAATRLDVIVANLPYLSATVYRKQRRQLRWEPALALRSGVDGLGHYRRLLTQLAARPQHPSLVVLEADAAQVPALHSYIQSTRLPVAFTYTVVNRVGVIQLTARTARRTDQVR